MAPLPSAAALDRATALFLRPPPRFLYSAPRFLHLPVNSRMPEICILGRSNVGKSTLLNALAGLESGGKAGRSHGAKPGRLGLAITSARAGCTKMMNGYGFGPPLKGGEGVSPATVSSSSGGGTRSQRRARPAGEPSPAHSLVLLDLPGYGYLSRSEWGTEIAKYLERRTTLRGAVLLVDVVAGLKDGDRQALAMLRDANVRTLVVLTKADKLAGDRGDQKLRESCRRVWDALRRTERHSWGEVPWMEGQGWDRAIYVTGAGDPKGGGFGVAGTRLALCRMAGLLPEEVRAAGRERKSKSRGQKEELSLAAPAAPAPTATPAIVPFDQIQWAETTTEVVLDQADEQRMIAAMEAAKKSAVEEAAKSAVEEAAKSAVEEAAPKRTAGRIRPWRRRTTGAV